MVVSVNILHVTSVYHAGPRARRLLHHALVSCSGSRAIGASLTHRKPSMHIFVGNLEFSATEQDVRQLFERYGVVDTVRIMTDRETGRPRGFGFVEMPDGTAARAAIAGLQGHWCTRMNTACMRACVRGATTIRASTMGGVNSPAMKMATGFVKCM